MLDEMDRMREDRSETRDLPQVRAADMDCPKWAQKTQWAAVLAAISLF